MSLKKQRTQLLGNVIFLLVAVIYLILASQITVINVFGVTVVSSATIPRILGVLLLILDIISLFQNLAELKKACHHVTGLQPEVSCFTGYTDTAVIAGQLHNRNNRPDHGRVEAGRRAGRDRLHLHHEGSSPAHPLPHT